MLLGKLKPGATAIELLPDTKRVSRFTLPVAAESRLISKLAIYADGLGPRQTSHPLTLSGNEITDAIRAESPAVPGHSYDGRMADSSFGIWEASRNEVPNGGFETNTTGWAATAANTIARSTVRAKFGSASGKLTRDTSQADTSCGIVSLTLSAAAPWTSSVYVWITAGYSGSDVTLTAEGFAGATGTLTAHADMSKRDQWQRLAITFTPAGGDVAGSPIVMRLVGAATGDAVWIDGAQVEQKEFATPYIHTEGGAASRGSGSVRASVNYLNETAGAIVARVRMGFPSSFAPARGLLPSVSLLPSTTLYPSATVAANVDVVIFDWSDDGENKFQLVWSPAAGKWRAHLMLAGVEVAVAEHADTFAAGDLRTVGMTWSASELVLRVGGVSTTVSLSDVPSFATTTFGIGSTAGGGGWPLDGEMLWFTAGIAEVNLSLFDSAGDPGFARINDVPGSPLLYWPADTAAFFTPTPPSYNLLRGIIYDGVTDALLAVGDEIVLPDGSEGQWLDLPFDLDGIPLAADATDLDFGVLVGGAGSARVWADTEAPGGRFGSDSYANGPADPFAGAIVVSDPFGPDTAVTTRFAIYADVFPAWSPPANEFEMVLGRLPFLEAQKTFSETSPVTSTARNATLSWHGARLDIERGSFAIVGEGGPFEDLLGERVVIETTLAGKTRRVYAYVHNLAGSSEFVGDLTVSRRLFEQLAPLGLDSLLVTVTRLS
jgi:hypothetical protein